MQAITNGNSAAQVMTVVNQLVRQFDNTGSFTLTNGATATVVKNPKINQLSKIAIAAPRTADAASAVATTYISSIGTGEFIVSHANATTTRTFDYVIHGV